MKKLIVVDKKDQILGFKDKEICHNKQGILHRAFSVFVFNNKDELLIQKRSKHKRLWPLFWTNTCCSHPLKGEEIKESAGKRLKEELGFSCPLEFLFKLFYQAQYKDKGAENEITYVFKGIYQGKVFPNKKEVALFHWLSFKKLKKEIKEKPESFTPWFKKIFKRFDYD